MVLMLTEVPVASLRGRRTTAFDRLVTPEFRKMLKLCPGREFLVTDEAGRGHRFPENQVRALWSTVVEPFRVQARRDPGTDCFFVWVSMDPAYWEKLKKRAKK